MRQMLPIFFFMYLQAQVQQWSIFDGDFTETSQYAIVITHKLQNNTYWRMKSMKYHTH